MRIFIFILALLFLVIQANSEGLKLLKKSVRYDYYTFYPFENFLVIRTRYRGDEYLTVIDRQFNDKVIYISNYGSLLDIEEIGNQIFIITLKGDFYCLREVYPDDRKIFCYDYNFVNKVMDKKNSARIIYHFITEDKNVGLLKIPREAYSITELLFTGRFKFEGRFLKINSNRKIILKKDLNLDYKNIYTTKYGLYAKKNKNLIFIDINGNEKVLERNVKNIDKVGHNIIYVEKENGERLFFSKNIPYEIPENCKLSGLYLYCYDYTITDIKTGEKLKLPFKDYETSFLCKIGDKLIFAKNFKTFLITDLKGKIIDSFTPKNTRELLCLKDILIAVGKDKNIELFKIVGE